jgi:nucleotide-binding universal stress UspA family protein
MAIKDILTLIDLNRAESPSAAAAIDLAGRFGAHLTGVALAVDPMVPAMVTAPVPVEFAEHARAEALDAARAATAGFTERATAAGITPATKVVEVLMGGAPEAFLNQCRLTDLVVVGQDDPDQPEPLRDLVLEAALMEGGAPLLVVPYIAKPPLKFDRVMIAWDGSKTAARAVRMALPLLPLVGRFGVVIVGDQTAESGDPGADVATWLARHDKGVEIERIRAPETSVADALLNHAADHAYDLIVMGGYGHSRVREFLFGGATRDILANMTIPVVMVH